MDLRKFYTCDRLKECNTSPSCGTECTHTTDKDHAVSGYGEWIGVKDHATPRYGEWIPIAERLPNDGEWCLFTDGCNMSVERYKYDAIDHFYPPARWFEVEDVIAWMPLPEPPERV